MQLPDMAISGRPSGAQELAETAYAKVNLALHVRGRRADGYHELESLFVFAAQGDLLTGHATADGTLSLELNGPFGLALGVGPDNLVVKAALALQEHLGAKRGAALILTKNLPVASGIGGGSADAAAALRLLNRLWNAGVSEPELERMALSLGSDVPACVTSVTQMVRGRGEVLEQREVAGIAGKPMLLVNPGVAVPTARIFERWDRQDRGPLAAGDLQELIAQGRNDLEPAATAVAPVIVEVLALLRQCDGVSMARMSGSGATCFALFDNMRARISAAAAVRAARPDWWVMETEIRAA